MSLWNVFRMELFKNRQDRASLIIMLAFMLVNTLAAIMMSTLPWFHTPIFLFTFSMIGSVLFLFIYPYRMARIDYKNKVMSLLIASGVSRTQYYFVKVGATSLFSLLSVILIVMIPLFFGALASDGLSVATEIIYDALVVIDASTFAIVFFTWLSAFSILMTSIIISRGRFFAVFIFFGVNLVTGQLTELFSPFGWYGHNITAVIFFQILSTFLAGLIGIFVLRAQDL